MPHPTPHVERITTPPERKGHRIDQHTRNMEHTCAQRWHAVPQTGIQCPRLVAMPYPTPTPLQCSRVDLSAPQWGSAHTATPPFKLEG